MALIGLDQPAAEVLINLLTGASLPDTGEVHIFGRSTAEITDSTDWLATLDRFGIVSERAALLEPMTVIQNWRCRFRWRSNRRPLTWFARRSALAREAGLAESVLGAARRRPRCGDAHAASPRTRARVRTRRAACSNIRRRRCPREQVRSVSVCDVRLLAERRGIATLTITADAEFAGAVSAVAVAARSRPPADCAAL